MKKFLAIVLAVICIFSMATVAFAATTYPTWDCDACGAVVSDWDEWRSHVENVCDRVCLYCGHAAPTNEKKAEHEYCCLSNVVTCDYCGDGIASQKAFDEHLDACKAKYYNIPLAKIIATIKDLFSKIDFEQVIGALKGVIGNLGIGA